jgi:survival-of-motor-neuron-related-splicing factor 30
MENQLQEYECQLADIEELLEASPGDESLLALKNDLVELISLTKAGSSGDPEPLTQNNDSHTTISIAEQDGNVERPDSAQGANDDGATASEQQPEAKKKLQNVKEFEIPVHLIPLETDTEAEKNKKRRAIKALKSKWREKKKAFESSKKQQTWQNFQQKKKRKGTSIFATQDGDNAKTGVISGGTMTEFGARKRHKHPS